MEKLDAFDEITVKSYAEQVHTDASALFAVQKSTTPTLFIHGKDDAMINASMSVALYEAASCPKELLLVDGAGHAQAQDKAPEAYYDTIYNFLEQYIRH